MSALQRVRRGFHRLGLLIAAIPLIAAADCAYAASVMVYGVGVNSCRQWTQDRTQKDRSWEATADGQWVDGFVAGYNFGLPGTADITSGTDAASYLAWIDNYCAQHPLNTIGNAAIDLVEQLKPTQPTPAQPASKDGRPCAQITAACKQAGFVPGGAKTGVGLALDCIRPILQGTRQRAQATKSLPQIDPQVVAACKQQDPNFGMGSAAKPNVQPTSKPPGT